MRRCIYEQCTSRPRLHTGPIVTRRLQNSKDGTGFARQRPPGPQRFNRRTLARPLVNFSKIRPPRLLHEAYVVMACIVMAERVMAPPLVRVRDRGCRCSGARWPASALGCRRPAMDRCIYKHVTTFRRMPTANAEGARSDRRAAPGKVSGEARL